MRRATQSFAVVLLALTTVNALVARGPLASTETTRERPAGCHLHGHKAPAQAPASYVCCVAGHESALLQPSTVQPLILQDRGGITSSRPSRPTPLQFAADDLFPTSGDPPGLTPLRI